MLSDETRARISAIFCCPCLSRYSNQENGVLGQDNGIDCNIFLLNEAHYITEILKMDRDAPADIGEVGRIVITDLYNYALPMIRYDTGDIGAMTVVEQNGIRKRAIDQFGGRRMDMILDCQGQYISPHKISVLLCQCSESKQFQFIQNADGIYTLKIVPLNTAVNKHQLKSLCLDLLGHESQIKIEMVDNIPTLKSGKYKYIINEMNQRI